MFKLNLRSVLRSSLHLFGVLSESIDELIDNKIVWGMIPKRLQNLIWQIDLRAGNLHHMSELDNWGSHEPFNKICCKLGRHDYFCHSLLKPRGGGWPSVTICYLYGKFRTSEPDDIRLHTIAKSCDVNRDPDNFMRSYIPPLVPWIRIGNSGTESKLASCWEIVAWAECELPVVPDYGKLED